MICLWGMTWKYHFYTRLTKIIQINAKNIIEILILIKNSHIHKKIIKNIH